MFLSPMTGLIAAAIVTATLVVLYILKLHRRPLRISSVMLWPKAHADSQVNTPFQRFRFSWLFFLHLLILLLACAALARPAIIDPTPSGERLIVLIDRSASMSARDELGGPTRLERARERATEIVNTALRVGSGRQICVVSFAAEPVALTGWTTSRNAARVAVESVTQTDQPGRIDEALRLCSALAASEESGPSTTIIIVSDGSFPASAERVRAPGPVNYERIGSKASSILPMNAGILAVAARRDFTDPSVVRLFAQVGWNDPTLQSIPMSLSFNGTKVLEKFVTLTRPQTGAPLPYTVPLPLELRSSEAGLLTLSLGIDDALPSDNTASLVLSAPTKPSIVLVQPQEDSTTDPRRWLLADVLEELQPRRLDRVSAVPTDLRGVNLLILDRVPAPSGIATPTLSFGVEPAIAGVTVEPLDPARSTQVLVWEREHPALAGLSLDSLRAEQSFRMTISPQVAVQSLVTGRSGPLMLQWESQSTRHITVGFDLARSNWPLLPSFAPFVASAVDYLSMQGQALPTESFLTSRPATVRSPPGVSLTIKGPMNFSVDVPPDADADMATSLGVLPMAGVYTVQGATTRWVAVNLLDATETALQSPEEITIGKERLSLTAAGSSTRELWPWILLALFVALQVEWYVFARANRV